MFRTIGLAWRGFGSVGSAGTGQGSELPEYLVGKRS